MASRISSKSSSWSLQADGRRLTVSHGHLSHRLPWGWLWQQAQGQTEQCPLGRGSFWRAAGQQAAGLPERGSASRNDPPGPWLLPSLVDPSEPQGFTEAHVSMLAAGPSLWGRPWGPPICHLADLFFFPLALFKIVAKSTRHKLYTSDSQCPGHCLVLELSITQKEAFCPPTPAAIPVPHPQSLGASSLFLRPLDTVSEEACSMRPWSPAASTQHSVLWRTSRNLPS